jgi:hypothetical protein
MPNLQGQASHSAMRRKRNKIRSLNRHPQHDRCCSVTSALASSSVAVILETATVHVIGPDGRKIRGILLIDGGSKKTWIKQGISKHLKLQKLTVDKIGTRGFRQIVPSQTEKHNLVKFQVPLLCYSKPWKWMK